MRVARFVAFLAGLLPPVGIVLGLPVENTPSGGTTSNPGWAPGWRFTLPSILKRDGEPAPPACDWVCARRLLYQTAFSATSSGIEFAMATYKAQQFCFEQEAAWCPQVVESSTTMIASKSSFMTIDYAACDDACLLLSMHEVSRRGAMYGMQWAEQMFAEENFGANQDDVDKLHWSMWYLSRPEKLSVSSATLKGRTKAEVRPWNATVPVSNSTTSNGDPTESVKNSTVPMSNSTSNSNASSQLSSSHPAINLLAPYLSGGPCNDAYLCEENSKNYITDLVKRASSAVNGTTWLGFMLTAGDGSSQQGGRGSTQAERRPTFPSWTAEAPCTGCAPPPEIGRQPPPPDWSPQSIPEPPVNPNAPEMPKEPAPDQKPPDAEEKADEEIDRERKEQERKEIEEKCKSNEKCRLEEQKKIDDERKAWDDQEKEAQRKIQGDLETDQERKDRDAREIAEKCKQDEKCLLQKQKEKEAEYERIEEERAKESRKQEDLREVEAKCKHDEQCKAEEQRKKDDDRKAQEKKDRVADEERKKLKDEEIERRCGKNKQCVETEKADDEARRKFDKKKGKLEDAAERQPLRSCMRKTCPTFTPGGNLYPAENPTLDATQRFRSTLYDPDSGTMKAEHLRYRPTHKQKLFIEELTRFSRPRLDRLIQFDYQPFEVMEIKDGVEIRTGKYVWHRWSELMPMDDASWTSVGKHVFKKGAGQLARNALGDPIVNSAKVKEPETATPIRDKRATFNGGDELAKYRIGDANGNFLEEKPYNALDVKNWGPMEDQIDWNKVINVDTDELATLHKELNQADRPWYPARPKSDSDPTWPGPEPGSWNPDKKPKRLNPSAWPPEGLDGADDSDLLDRKQIEQLKKGELGKLPKPSSYPKIPNLSKISEVARWTQKASSALLPAGPVGWLVMLGTMGMAEFVMFSQAKGDPDVWWHCVQERVNPAGVHACGQVDENGNEIVSEDEGPFENFVKNYYGYLLNEDIDGDGEMENAFEKFFASMQDLGDLVYDFFDSSEDGTGFVENTWSFVKNGVKTIVHVVQKGWQWVEEKAQDAGEKIHGGWHKVKNWAHKTWNKIGSWFD